MLLLAFAAGIAASTLAHASLGAVAASAAMVAAIGAGLALVLAG